MSDNRITPSATESGPRSPERAVHARADPHRHVAATDDPVRDIHPAAEIFPLLGGDAFEALVADVKLHGLRQAITLDASGRILDGRNRWRACEVTGVEPRFETWDGEGPPLDYVLSANLHRRHLNEGQRALIAARLATMRQGERTDLSGNSGRFSQTDAAKLLRVSPDSVGSARKVLDEGDPMLVTAVERGDVPVSTAAAIARLDPDAQREVISQGPHAVREEAKRLRSRPVNKGRRARTDSVWVLTRAEEVVLEKALLMYAKEYGVYDGGAALLVLAEKLGIHLEIEK